MPELATIEVELAYAEADRQFLRRFRLPRGSCVADAIRASGVEASLGIDVAGLDAGIWSKPVPRDVQLREGDRVELYRPLEADPKEARRRRAQRNAARRQP